MKPTNTHVLTFPLGTIYPQQESWLRSQLVICIKIRKMWEEQKAINNLSPTFFGISRESLSKAIPEAIQLSSYVNHGMCGKSLQSLQTEFATGFQYSPSNKSGAYQTQDLNLYLSGFPGGLVPLVGAVAIPEGLTISAVQFHMDKESQKWSATICSRYRRPKNPSKRH